MPWGVVSVLFGLHLLTISMIGLRFVTPLSTEAKLVRHTIQLTPRLSEPPLVTDVLVEHNQHVKAGAPLFQSSTAAPTSTPSRPMPTSSVRLRVASEIDGVNTSVVAIQAELALARFYGPASLRAPEGETGVRAGAQESAHFIPLQATTQWRVRPRRTTTANWRLSQTRVVAESWGRWRPAD